MLGAADSTALSVMCVVNIKARVCGERTTGEDDSRWSERAASCACLPLCTQPNGFSGEEEEEEETPSPDQSPTTGVACKLGSSRVRVVRVGLGVGGENGSAVERWRWKREAQEIGGRVVLQECMPYSLDSINLLSRQRKAENRCEGGRCGVKLFARRGRSPPSTHARARERQRETHRMREREKGGGGQVNLA